MDTWELGSKDEVSFQLSSFAVVGERRYACKNHVLKNALGAIIEVSYLFLLERKRLSCGRSDHGGACVRVGGSQHQQWW